MEPHKTHGRLGSVQSLSPIQLFATPWTAAARPPCPSPTPGAGHLGPPLITLSHAHAGKEQGKWQANPFIFTEGHLGAHQEKN